MHDTVSWRFHDFTDNKFKMIVFSKRYGFILIRKCWMSKTILYLIFYLKVGMVFNSCTFLKALVVKNTQYLKLAYFYHACLLIVVGNQWLDFTQFATSLRFLCFETWRIWVICKCSYLFENENVYVKLLRTMW